MKKIKELLNTIWQKIANVFKKIGCAIGSFFAKLGETKVMRSIIKVLRIIPDWIVENVSHQKRKVIWGLVFIAPLLIGFVFFFLIPFITTIIYSFSNVSNTAEGIKTTYVGFANYRYALMEHPTFNETLLTSILSTALDIPIILTFSLLMAVILNTKFKSRALVRAIFFMPVIFNSQAIDVATASSEALQASINATTQELFASMFNFKDFLINANIPPTFVGYLSGATQRIYDIISFSGVQILIFLSGIQSVPKHLYEAAKIEGATQYEIFWKITFPMVSPLMLTAGVYTVVDSFLRSPIIKTLASLNNAQKVTNSLGIELTNYGINAAMSWLYCLASLVVLAIAMFLLSRMVFYYDE